MSEFALDRPAPGPSSEENTGSTGSGPAMAAFTAIVMLATTVGSSAAFAQDAAAVARPPLVEGRVRWVATTEPIEDPRSATFAADGVLWVLDAGKVPRLVPLRRGDGELPPAIESEAFSGPTRVAGGRDGTLLVSDPAARTVHRVRPSDGAAIVEPAFDASPDRTFEPIAAAETAEGFAIIDRRESGVLLLDRGGRVLRRVGSDDIPGGWGQPIDLAVAADGRIHVADRDRHRIVVLAADGAFLHAFGDRGPFPGLFVEPFALEIAGDRLLVADRLNHRIAIHTLEGEPAGQWGMHAVTPRQGEGRIHYPVDLAVSPDAKTAVVVEPFERRVQWFECDATSEPTAAQGELPSLDGVLSHFGSGIASDGDLAALWEPETASVVVFDWRGALPIHVTTFGGPGTAPDRLGRVAAIAVDADPQRVAIADAANRRIAFVDLARDRGTPLRFDPFMGRTGGTVSLARIGAGVEALAGRDRIRRAIEPRALAWLPGGSLALLDAANGLVIVLAPRPASPVGSRPLPAEVVSVWGVDDAGEASLDRPVAMALSPAGDALAVLDRSGTRIEVIGLDGTPRPDLARDLPEGVAAAGLAWTEHGFAVSDPRRDALLLLDEADPVVRHRLGGRGVADGNLWLPAGLSRRDDGVVLVVDQGNHRVQGFASEDGAWRVVFSLGRASNRQRAGGGE